MLRFLGSMPRLFLPGEGREGLAGALLLVAGVLSVGGWLLWRHVAPTALASDDYWLPASDIRVQPDPQWIAAEDLRREALRNASFEPSLNLLDDKLVERVALAFAAHPWVKDVQRVEKFHPARVEVTLNYRQPVASVLVGTELLPVDLDAHALPSENFPPAELAKFPKVTGILTRPAKNTGGGWNDDGVRGAALIAAALGPNWQELGLSEIYTMVRRTVRGNQCSYVLVTRSGAKIPWGVQPLPEQAASGLSADEKAARLLNYVRKHGSLDGVTMRWPSTSAIPRTAALQMDDALLR